MSKMNFVNEDFPPLGGNISKKVTEKVNVIESVPLPEVKKKNKLSEAQYQKKLEKKASKKAQKEAEEKEINDKLNAEEEQAKIYAQKAYDEEYTVAWIEETKEEIAKLRAQKAFNKAFEAKLNLLRKPNVQKNILETLVEPIAKEFIIEDSESDEELPSINQTKFTEEKIVSLIQLNEEVDNDGFQIVKNKTDRSKSLFLKRLDFKKREYVDTILTKDMLTTIYNNFQKNNKLTVPLNLENDILESSNDYTITKSGFLKNKLFSKLLSSEIYKKLNKMKVFVSIDKLGDNKYNLILDKKN